MILTNRLNRSSIVTISCRILRGIGTNQLQLGASGEVIQQRLLICRVELFAHRSRTDQRQALGLDISSANTLAGSAPVLYLFASVGNRTPACD